MTAQSTAETNAAAASQDFWVRAGQRIFGLGIALCLISSMFSVTATFLTKFIPGVHPLTIVVIRSSVQAAVYIIPALRTGVPIMGNSRSETYWLAMRGFSGFFTFICVYSTVRLIPYSDAITIIQSAPVYTAIFAAFVLKERCGPVHIITILITMVGVVLIARPGFLFEDEVMDQVRLIGVFVGFCAAIIRGSTFVIVRKLRHLPGDLLLLWFAMSSFILGSIGYLFCKHVLEIPGLRMPINTYEWGLCVMSAFCGVLQQNLMVYALKIEQANVIALTKSVDIVFGFLAQGFFLTHEPIQITSLAGAFTIILAVSMSVLRKYLSINKSSSETCMTQSIEAENNTSPIKSESDLELGKSQNSKKGIDSLQIMMNGCKHISTVNCSNCSNEKL